jgi:hypothetical protein
MCTGRPRLLADHLGISFATAALIWRRWGLQPWKVETFKFIVPRLSYCTSTGARPLGTARGVHDYGDTDEAYRGADDVKAVRAEPFDNHAQTNDTATNTPPYAPKMRPELASVCKVATKPYRPSATMPAPTHGRPRYSRTPELLTW